MGIAQITDTSNHVLSRTSRYDGRAIVEVEGPVDVTTACELGRVLARITDEGDGDGEVIVVDLSAADLVDSAALATLLFAQKHARRQNGDLLLAGLNSRSQRLLRMTGLDLVFNVLAEARAT